MSTQPQPLPVTEVKLTDTIKSLVNGALAAKRPMSFAYTDDDGKPNLSLRGSVLVYNDTQLAVWVRNPEGGLVKALAKHPHLALLYADPAAEQRSFLTFRGRGRFDDSEAVRRDVYDRSPEVERNLDKERKGKALIIDLDSVHGMAAGQRLQMVKK